MTQPPDRPGICFTAIVKDEERCIRRCLESVKPWITCWAISDTGSRDKTVEIVNEVLGDLPGVLRHDKWQDFSTNRNLALYAAKDIAQRVGAAYIMTLDADEELVMPEDVNLSLLEQDGYTAPFIRPEEHEDESTWHRMLLAKSDMNWHFEGTVHEQLVCPGARVGLLLDFKVISHFDGARQLKGELDKYKADAKILKRAVKKNPKDARAWFYYARAVASAGKIDAAIDAYRTRIRLGGGFAEEVFHCYYQIAALKEMRGDHWEDIARAYLQAHNARPTRAEPLWALSVIHRQAGEHVLAEMFARRAASLPFPVSDGLFVNRSIYEWRALDEFAGTLAQLGHLQEASDVLEHMLTKRELPAENRVVVLKNLEAVQAILTEGQT